MADPFMSSQGPQKVDGGKSGKNIGEYISEILRLKLIKEFFIGRFPLSRGTRESHFVEAWIRAVSGEDRTNDPSKPGYKPRVRLRKTLAFLENMRDLSPHEGGKQIEVLRDVLSTQPNNVTLVGSPYDVTPQGPFTKVVETVTGKKQEDRVRYNK